MESRTQKAPLPSLLYVCVWAVKKHSSHTLSTEYSHLYDLKHLFTSLSCSLQKQWHSIQLKNFTLLYIVSKLRSRLGFSTLKNENMAIYALCHSGKWNLKAWYQMCDYENWNRYTYSTFAKTNLSWIKLRKIELIDNSSY